MSILNSHNMSQHDVFHGSEDGQPPSSNTPAVSLTVTDAGSPGPFSNSTVSGASNPLFTAGDALEHMGPEDFETYLEKRIGDGIVSAGVLEIVGPIGGQEWIELITCLNQDQTVNMLREELKVPRMVVVSKLLADVHKARDRLAERVVWTEERAQLQSQLSVERAKALEAAEELAKGKQDREGSKDGSKQPLDRVKLEDMPKFPNPTAGECMVSSLQLDRFKVSLTTWLRNLSKAMADGVTTLIDKPDTDLSTITGLFDDKHENFDCRLASTAV